MSDVNCPYCETEQEINHDDGYGYEESDLHEQECVSCDKTFKFSTSISFSYEVFCAGEHELEQCQIDGIEDLWDCKHCDYYEVKR